MSIKNDLEKLIQIVGARRVPGVRIMEDGFYTELVREGNTNTFEAIYVPFANCVDYRFHSNPEVTELEVFDDMDNKYIIAEQKHKPKDIY